MVDNGAKKRTVGGSRNSKEFRCWSSLRAAFSLAFPCCGCYSTTSGVAKPTFSAASSTVTGTIFGQRKGRVSFCVQEDPASPPILLVEFAIPTYLLVKEMESGLLRITLECAKNRDRCDGMADLPLFEEPVWGMSCNGRRVGFAMKKSMKYEEDSAMTSIMSLMQSVSTGAGVIPSRRSSHSSRNSGEGEDEELLYMRATYERVVGSCDSEAFHMVGPDGSQAQEISIFVTLS